MMIIGEYGFRFLQKDGQEYLMFQTAYGDQYGPIMPVNCIHHTCMTIEEYAMQVAGELSSSVPVEINISDQVFINQVSYSVIWSADKDYVFFPVEVWHKGKSRWVDVVAKDMSDLDVILTKMFSDVGVDVKDYNSLAEDEHKTHAFE